MSERRLHLPAGSLRTGQTVLELTSEAAGWRYAGLRVIEIQPGTEVSIDTEEFEYAVLPLTGAVDVVCDEAKFVLRHRESVFTELPDVAYVPRESSLRLSSSSGARVALPSAHARRRGQPFLVRAEDVPVEVRGAGACTRQVNNFLDPRVEGPDRLLAVEVLTPEGNWSSYPPHKHDEEGPDEAELEEIYYFEVRGGGFGVHRCYANESRLGPAFDESAAVGSGDVFLIPRGYHGPSMAAPGYDLYYLNVLAGPAERRSMAFCDDPAHHWIRGSWEAQPTDPRVPMATAIPGNAPAP